MICLRGESADDVWLRARELFLKGSAAAQTEGRGSPTREIRPVFLELSDPRQRWVASRTPALNPAAVLSEVVWILNGRNDSRFVNFWNNKLREYAGDGDTYHGAYGFRLRRAFGLDQLGGAADALLANPESRQVCLSIWKPDLDLPAAFGQPQSPDIPCNVTSLLKVRDGRLEWTQVMRSNDFWLGLPFNIVQFTMLQEIMAGWIGVDVGSYHHLSDSLHIYPRDEQPLKEMTPLEILPQSTDSLSTVGRRDSFRLLKEMTTKLDQIVEEEGEPDWQTVEPGADWPAAYANILRGIVAEAARRKGQPEVASEIMDACTNPLLRLMWRRWGDRIEAQGGDLRDQVSD